MHIFSFFRRTTLTFVKKVHEKDDVYTFFFTPKKPIKHIAGQHSLFVFPSLLNARPFSLASSPDEPYVIVGTRVGSGSRFKKALVNMKPGDHIQMFGPYLNFITPQDDRPIIMLAQGIGITPFRSLLLWLHAHQPARSTTLIHVDSADHTYRSETSALAQQSSYPTTPQSFTGALEGAAKQQPAAWWYISGSPRFVRGATKLLKEHGVSARFIKKDGFLGY